MRRVVSVKERAQGESATSVTLHVMCHVGSFTGHSNYLVGVSFTGTVVRVLMVC